MTRMKPYDDADDIGNNRQCLRNRARLLLTKNDFQTIITELHVFLLRLSLDLSTMYIL